MTASGLPTCRRLQATAAAHFHVARDAAAKLGAVHRIPDPHFRQAWLAELLNIARHAPPELVGEELFGLLLPAARASVSLWACHDMLHAQASNTSLHLAWLDSALACLHSMAVGLRRRSAGLQPAKSHSTALRPCTQVFEAVPDSSPSQRLSEAGAFLAKAASRSPRLTAALVTSDLLQAALELPAGLEPGCLSVAEVRAPAIWLRPRRGLELCSVAQARPMTASLLGSCGT